MAASRPTVVLPIAEYSVLGNIDDATVEHVVQVVRRHVHANGQTREGNRPWVGNATEESGGAFH